jgi:hypothetical protein
MYHIFAIADKKLNFHLIDKFYLEFKIQIKKLCRLKKKKKHNQINFEKDYLW